MLRIATRDMGGDFGVNGTQTSAIAAQHRSLCLILRHVSLLDHRGFHCALKPCLVELQANLRLAPGRKNSLEKNQSEATVCRLLDGWPVAYPRALADAG
jgi:hypothetical protein